MQPARPIGGMARTNDPGSRGSVLVVDDEKGPRESLRLILGPYFDVRTVVSGEAALEELATSTLDVITLDLKMPDVDGIRTFGRIREIDTLVEVIIVTGYGSYNSAVWALRLGAFDYITKPFDPSTVLDVVSRAAERHRQRLRDVPAEDLAPSVDDLVRQADELEGRSGANLPADDRAALRRIRYLARTLRYLSSPPPQVRGKGKPGTVKG